MLLCPWDSLGKHTGVFISRPHKLMNYMCAFVGREEACPLGSVLYKKKKKAEIFKNWKKKTEVKEEPYIT